MKQILMAVLVNCVLIANLSCDEASAPNWTDYKKNVLKSPPKVQVWYASEKAGHMMDLIYETKPSVYVQVGVFDGGYFYPAVAALAYNNKGIGYGIDPWHNPDSIKDDANVNKEWWSRVDLRAVMNGFIDRMAAQRLNPWYCLVRMTSQQSVGRFKDESIDILHIEGDRAEEASLFDAMHWLPKVKKGGYIWFDEANWSTAAKAVDYLLQYCDLDSHCTRKDPYILMKKRADSSS